jgi:hypothetical protein
VKEVKEVKEVKGREEVKRKVKEGRRMKEGRPLPQNASAPGISSNNKEIAWVEGRKFKEGWNLRKEGDKALQEGMSERKRAE